MTNKALYPEHWTALRLACLARAEWKCEHCGIAHGTSLVSARTDNPYYVYLHAAHVHHDVANPEPELMALCPTCHGRYDYQHRRREQRVWLERLKHRLLLARPALYRWYWQAKGALA